MVGFTLLLPLLMALLLPLLKRWPNLRDGFSLLGGVALFLLCVSIIQQPPATQMLWQVMPGFALMLTPEPLGMVFALLVSFLWPVTTLYSIGYLRAQKDKHQTRFFTYFTIAIACTMGIAFAGNLFTTFIFYEALTLSTLPLVAHNGGKEARQAGSLYIAFLMGASLLLFLPAIAWIAHSAGTLTYKPGGIVINGAPILLFLCLFGVAKAAVMSLHRWLPAAMVAPVPVSALLHAVAVVKSGVFILLKLMVYVFGLHTLESTTGWMTTITLASALLAALFACQQEDVKKRLAYSTISQLSTILAAASIATPLAILAAMLQLCAHAFAKITLFFTVGSAFIATGAKQMRDFDGLGKTLPWTIAAMSVGAFSLIGLPPLFGFFSKSQLMHSAFPAHLPLLAGLALCTLLSMGYLLPLLARSYSPHKGAKGKVPITMALAQWITASGCISLGMAIPWLQRLLETLP